MANPQPRPATYQDIIDLPEHLVGEIIAGELYTQPRPAPRQARASSVVGGKLTGPFDAGDGGPGGSWILDEPELHLGHLWLLDPDQRTLEVYQNAGGRWLLLGVFENEDEVAVVPFDAIAFNLGGLWAD